MLRFLSPKVGGTGSSTGTSAWRYQNLGVPQNENRPEGRDKNGRFTGQDHGTSPQICQTYANANMSFNFPCSKGKKIFFFMTDFRRRGMICLEWFSEAGSAPIRSAVKFYFNIDVSKKISTFSKNIFSVDKIFLKKFGSKKKYRKKI